MTKILIIDDDEQILRLFSRNFENKGYQVFAANNGDLGIKIFQEKFPDIILVDIIMPDKEGIEIIREILAEYPKTNIIAISAGGRGRATDYLEYAMKFGAKRVLEKPIDLDNLTKIVEEVLAAN